MTGDRSLLDPRKPPESGNAAVNGFGSQISITYKKKRKETRFIIRVAFQHKLPLYLNIYTDLVQHKNTKFSIPWA
jgi:hypothetical protein